MTSVLVTGATGTLGSAVVAAFERAEFAGAGWAVRALRRRASTGSSRVTWATGDLVTGQGIDAACDGIDVVVHCASDGRTRRGDAAMTSRLLQAARRGRPHVVYISIVGVDRIPLGYYRGKLDTENLLAASGLPHTILRTTQFHDLLFRLVSSFDRWPLVLVPSAFRFQPVDVQEVARRLSELALGPPAGRVADMGGPAVRSAADLARAYLKARSRRRVVLRVPLFGKIARGFRAGLNLAPDQAVGRRTWEEYLTARVAGGKGSAETLASP